MENILISAKNIVERFFKKTLDDVNYNEELCKELGFDNLPALHEQDSIVEENIKVNMPFLTTIIYAHRLMRYIIIKKNDEEIAKKYANTCVLLSIMFWKAIKDKHGNEYKYSLKQNNGNLMVVKESFQN
jgi:hypothetical protein